MARILHMALLAALLSPTAALADRRHQDPAIDAALAMLAPIATPAARIVLVGARPRFASPSAEAWVITDGAGQNIIYVATYQAAYRNAMELINKPDNWNRRYTLLRLAAIIAHEQAHLDGGDEAAAYTRQLDVLRQLAAPKSLLNSVKASMDVVTGN